MKLMYAIVLLGMVSCNSADKKDEPLNMPGAYNMLSQSANDGTKDTSFAGAQQLKIYTDDYMMFAKINPPDSVSRFGIGAYTADSGKVVEHAIDVAADTAGTAATTGTNNFTLMIEKTPKGYKQVIPDMGVQGKKWTLTEEYESVGTAVKAPLDGAWKQTRAYYIKGSDTATNTPIQYKTYYAGHFIWGHRYKDSTNKLRTGIGFGTFTMDAANKVKETLTASSYYQVRGKTIDIDVEMNGADEFKQTITEANGDKNVEVYQRLKK